MQLLRLCWLTDSNEHINAMQQLETLNQHFFLWLNATPQTPAFAMTLATLLAEWLIYLLPVLLLAMWSLGNSTTRQTALKALLTALLALGLAQVIGYLWPHPRPFMLELGHTWLAHAPEASFPSDHATLCFSIGIALLLSRWFWTGFATVLLGLLVGGARVYLGVHFPLDVAGALLLALPCAWLTSYGLSRTGLDGWLECRLYRLWLWLPQIAKGNHTP